MAILTFEVSIEVGDELPRDDLARVVEDCRTVLAEFEEIVARRGYDLNDAKMDLEGEEL